MSKNFIPASTWFTTATSINWNTISTIAPGADPEVIAIHFDGVDKISVNAQGELILNLAGGEIRQPKPVIYQTAGGARKEIEGGYRLVDAHTVAFAVGRMTTASRW